MLWYGALFFCVLVLVTLWPAFRAAQRKRPRLAIAYAIAGVVLVFVAPGAVHDAWEAANPDLEWSMSAPEWLYFGTSPFVILPSFLIATWLINLAGWRRVVASA